MLPAYPEAAAVEGEVGRGGDDLFPPPPPMLAVDTDLFGVEVWDRGGGKQPKQSLLHCH